MFAEERIPDALTRGRRLARQCYHWRRVRKSADELVEAIAEARPPVAPMARAVTKVVVHLETAAELKLYRFLLIHGEPIRFAYKDRTYRVRIDPETNDHVFDRVYPRRHI